MSVNALASTLVGDENNAGLVEVSSNDGVVIVADVCAVNAGDIADALETSSCDRSKVLLWLNERMGRISVPEVDFDHRAVDFRRATG